MTTKADALRGAFFGAGLGMAVFFLAQTALLSFAKLINFDFRSSWLLLLPAALLAGLVAGAMSRWRSLAVGAVAASPWLVMVVVVSLAVKAAGGPFPTLDLTMASLILHPLLGALGGWIGAHWLPAIPAPPTPQSRARTSTTLMLFLAGYVSVIAVLYTTDLPRLLLVTVMVALSWGYGAHVWLDAKSRPNRWRAVFFVGLGALLALTTWQTPAPPPVTSEATLGLLVGGVSGALLVWRLYRQSDAQN